MARFMKARPRGVNVFKLNDGTYVQDTATTENSNTAVPYPLDINSPGAPISRGFNPLTGQEQAQYPTKWVVLTYYGGHSYSVTSAEAAALTAAGYGGRIS